MVQNNEHAGIRHSNGHLPPEIRERCHLAPDLSQQFDDHKYLQEGV